MSETIVVVPKKAGRNVEFPEGTTFAIQATGPIGVKLWHVYREGRFDLWRQPSEPPRE